LNKILEVLEAGSFSPLTSQESTLIFTGLSPVSPCVISDGTRVSYFQQCLFWPSRQRHPLVKEVLTAREFSTGPLLNRT